MQPLKLGIFDYVNIWPVYHRFLSSESPSGSLLVRGVPSELNRLLSEGKIQISCISSIQYPVLRNEIFLVPSLALASRGRVRSVFLVAKAPLRYLSGGTLFATKASATSVALLKILLNFAGAEVEMSPSDAPLAAYREAGGGCLLIGDEALRFGASYSPGSGEFLYDLGELWFQATGKPFVWGVWGVRKEAAGRSGNILRALMDSRDAGMQKLDRIALEAASRLRLEPAFMEEYFRGFSYSFREGERNGLLLFYKEASKLGISPPCDELQFLESEVLSCS